MLVGNSHMNHTNMPFLTEKDICRIDTTQLEPLKPLKPE